MVIILNSSDLFAMHMRINGVEVNHLLKLINNIVLNLNWMTTKILKNDSFIILINRYILNSKNFNSKIFFIKSENIKNISIEDLKWDKAWKYVL